jgi:hypothetical protein
MLNTMSARRWLWLSAGALLVLAATVSADPNWRQNGNSQAAHSAREGGQCVRETKWMRRNHMALIKHDRTVTVHQGVRTVDGSLAECVACHVNKDEHDKYVAINSSDEFCAGCHEFTGVTMDCFSCHATVPAK